MITKQEAANACAGKIEIADLIKNIPGGMHQCACDKHFSLMAMSDGFPSMFGYTREEIHQCFQDHFIQMILPADRKNVWNSLLQQLKKGSDIELEYRVVRKDGRPVWILDKGRICRDHSGDTCFYCLLVEITERRKEQEELRLSLERHQVIMDQATDIIFEWNILSDTLTFSPNWRKKFGYDPIESEISDQIPLSENIHPKDMTAFIKIMKDTAAGIPFSEAEFRIRNSEGYYIWCRIRATTQFDDEKRPIKAVGVIVDVDMEKKQQQDLMEQVQRDALTGLYNKKATNAQVERLMKDRRSRGWQALMIIDVDHFKAVNDTYGHLCGDSVLSDVAAALKGHVRSTDLVGRIGGDEFLVYLPQVADVNAARAKAEEFLEAIERIVPESGALPVSCSIGLAFFKRGTVDYLHLYQCADQALYHRKKNGRSGLAVYDPELCRERAVCGYAVSAVGAPIGSEDGNVVDEQLAQYAFRTLYTATDIQLTMNRLLEIIGRSYDVSRAYIFEDSEDHRFCSNTFEWCGEGVSPQMEKLQNLSYENELKNYLDNFDEHGLFFCRDIKSLEEEQRSILEPQGIHSLLQCLILDEGRACGYVGFDECKESRRWNKSQVASFKLTADVLSVFIVKLRMKQKLEKAASACENGCGQLAGGELK